MLPPGFYICRSGIVDLADPIDLDGLRRMHPAWREGLAERVGGERLGAAGLSFERFMDADQPVVVTGRRGTTLFVMPESALRP